MFRLSHIMDGVAALHVPYPSFGLCYCWDICLYVHTYDINTPLNNCMVEFEYGICPSLNNHMVEFEDGIFYV